MPDQETIDALERIDKAIEEIKKSQEKIMEMDKKIDEKIAKIKSTGQISLEDLGLLPIMLKRGL